jgi:hypothetical protein
MVNSTIPTYVISIPSQSFSHNQTVSVNARRILESPGVSQPGPLVFIIIGTIRPTMDVHMGGSITRYLEFWGKGEEYVEQHWFLSKAIWMSRGTLDENKLVEF